MNAQLYRVIGATMSGGEIELNAEAHQKWLDKEKEEKEFEAKFQEIKKEHSARAKKKAENKVLTELLKGADMVVKARTEKYQDQLSCPITYVLFEDPVLLLGDGKTYEREAIEEHFKRHQTSPLTGIDLPNENQRILVPNWAVRSACDAIRDGPEPEGRSNEIPVQLSTNETITLLQGKIMELRKDLAEYGTDDPPFTYEMGFENGYERHREDQDEDLRHFWWNFAKYMEKDNPEYDDGITPYAPIIYKNLIKFRHYLDQEEARFMKYMEETWEEVKVQLPNDHPTITGVSLIADPDDKYQEGLEHQQENVCDELASFWKELYTFFEERGTAETIFEQLRLFQKSDKNDEEISWIMNQMEALPPTPTPPDITRIRLEDMPGRR